jgi:glycolate oxidase
MSAANRREAVIHDPAETRAYECDALTAYRCPPLAVCCRARTEEVAAVLRICHEEGVPVVPRGSGTSLAGGALPDRRQRDPRRVADEPGAGDRYANRFIRVQAGRTNLSVTGAVERTASSTPPTPRASSPAPSRQYRDELGRRALPEIRRDHQQPAGRDDGLMDGEVVEIGGTRISTRRARPAGVICGSEGSSAS